MKWAHVDKKMIELENNQQWCVQRIQWLTNEVAELKDKIEQMEGPGAEVPQSRKSSNSEKWAEMSFTKIPDRSLLGLSKSKAYCTIIPKSSLDQKKLLTELGIDQANKQTHVELIDGMTGISYSAMVRCAYQDRSKTRKLKPEDLKTDIRILLEFKKYEETCKWFCLRLQHSIEVIESGGQTTEKVNIQYSGDKKFAVTFESG